MLLFDVLLVLGIARHGPTLNVQLHCRVQELVLEMFREMQLFGLAPDGFAINHCLQACDITEEYDAAANVIRGLWKMGTPVEDRTYTVAFSVLARGCHVKVRCGRGVALVLSVSSRVTHL